MSLINGLPAHVLIVHFVVVLVPLTALALAVCAIWPSAAQRMGIVLPPYTSLQGSSASVQHRLFTKADSHAERVKALQQAQVGDLVVVPGHVLMIIGHLNGQPYVIQDVPYAVFKDPATGQVRMTKLNQVSVTPLLPLYADPQTLYVDAMTSLVRVTQPLQP